MADKETKGIVIDISLTTSQVQKQVNELRRTFNSAEADLKSLQTAMKLDNTGLDLTSERFMTMASSMQRAEGVSRELERALKELLEKGITTENFTTFTYLTKQLAQANEKTAMARTRFDELKTGIIGVQEQTSKLMEQFNQFTNQATQVDIALKLDPQTVMNTESKLELLTLAAQSAKDALESMRDEMTLRLAQGAKLTDPEITKLAADIGLQQQATDKANASLEQYQKELADIASGLTASREAVAQANEKMRELDGIVSNLDKSLQINPDNLGMLYAKADTLSNSFEQARSKAQELQFQIESGLANGLNHTDATIAKLDADLAETTQAMLNAWTAAASFGNSIIGLNDRLSSGDLTKFYNDVKNTGVSFEQAKSAVASFNQSVNALHARELASLKNKITQTDTAIRNLAKAMVLDPHGFEDVNEMMRYLEKEANETTKYVEELNKEIAALDGDEFNDTSNEVAGLKKELAEAYERLQKLNDMMQRLGGSSEEANNAMHELAGESGVVAEETEDVANATDRATNSFNSLTVAMGNLLAQAIRRAIGLLKNLATSVYESGLEFDNANNSLKALYGGAVSDSEFNGLIGQFRELAVNGEFSATQIAENAKSLALAGYSAEETANAIGPILNLVQATGESFGDLSTIVVDGLAEFGKSADQAGNFADVLAVTAVNTNTDVVQLGEAMKYAGSVAGSFGYSIEDVAQALGTMATQGVKGSQAGTSLRTMLTRIANDTGDANTKLKALGVEFFNSKGEANDLSETLGKLRDVMKDMSTEEKAQLAYSVAGTRGLTALTAIVNTSADDWNALGEAIGNANDNAKNIATTRLDNLYGDVQKLKNNFSELGYQLYEDVSPAMRDMVQALTKTLQDQNVKNVIQNIATSIKKAMKGITDAIKKVGPNLNAIIASITSFAKTIGALVIADKATKWTKNLFDTVSRGVNSFHSLATEGFNLTSSFGAVQMTIQGAVLAISAINAAAEIMVAKFNDAHPVLAMLRDANNDLKDSVDSTRESLEREGNTIGNQQGRSEALINELERLTDSNGSVKRGYEDRVSYILGELSNAYGIEAKMVGGVIQNYDDLIAKYKETAQEQAKMAYSASLNDALTDAYTQMYEAQANMKSSSEEFARSVTGFLDSGAVDKTSGFITEFWKNMEQQYGVGYEQFKNLSDEKQREFVSQNAQMFGSTFGDQFLMSAAENFNANVQTYLDSLNLQSAINDALNVLSEGGSVADAMSAMNMFFEGIEAGTLTAEENLNSLQIAYEGLKQMISQADPDQKVGIAEMMTLIEQQIKELQGFTEDPENKVTVHVDEEATALEGQAGAEQFSTAVTDTLINDETRGETFGTEGEEDGEEYTTSLAEATTSGFEEEVTPAMQTGAESAHEAAKTTLNATNGFTLGKDWAQGIINGIQSMIAQLGEAGAAAGSAVEAGYRAQTKTESPSKVATELGEFWDEGIIRGLENGMGKVAQAAGAVGNVLTNTLGAGAMAFGTSMGNTSSYNVTQNLTFNGNYSKRDGLSVARDLDRLLGGSI